MPKATIDEFRAQRPVVCDPDVELVRRAALGDTPAFDTLVRRHEQRVFRTTMRVTRNDDDAKDAMQETFIKAYQHLNRFRRDSSFTTWLTRIAINEGLMILRKRRPNIVSLDDATPLSVEDGTPSPEHRFAQSQLNRILGKVIGELGPGSQVVFALRYTEQLSLKGIAATLNLPVPAVRLRLRRLRLDLRKNLNKLVRAGEFSGTPEGVNLSRNFQFDSPANR